MNSNKGNMSDNDKTGDIISWVIVIILMFVFPPLGWILLLVKLGVFTNRKAAPKKKRSRLDKKTGKGMSVFLLLVSIALFITGGSVLLGTLLNWSSTGLTSLAELSVGFLYLLGGVIAFFSRNIVPNRLARYKNYYAFIEGRDIISLSEIAQVGGVSFKAAIRDIQAMINNGFLDSGVYIDNELECLVLSPGAAEKKRMEIKGVNNLPPQSDNILKHHDQYEAILAELREVNSFISDEAISKKVDRLEELTAKIFKIVEETPEKKPQLRRFMSYYLPTTLKLVRSYATLEKQGIKGENIMATKKSICNILDTLSTGYEQQLDQLFKSDAIDIAADINVLENLMQQDGLTGGKAEFQVSESGTF